MSSNYRYAYQGQELDPETGMEAFQLRLWDGRLGRWLSPDPYGQYASPYLGMGNNPINGVDYDGGIFSTFSVEGAIGIGRWGKGFGKGVWGGLKGLGKSIWYLGDTAEGLVQFGLTGIASSGPNAYMSTLAFDNFFGTHTNQNLMGMTNSLSKFGNDLISSNPETSGEAWGNLGFSLLGTKGLGSLTKIKSVANISSKAKNVVNLTNKVDDGRYVYRSLNSTDAAMINKGNGLLAKSPNGLWTLEDHLIKGSRSSAWTNNPWIATSKNIEIAKGFSSGNGLIKIDLSKIPSGAIKEGWKILPRSSKGYHFSIWQQEVSIFQQIPRNAIQIIE